MLQLVAPILPLRARLLGKQASVKFSRVQLVKDNSGAPVKRIGFLDKVDFPGTATSAGAENLVCDNGISLQVVSKDYTKKYTKPSMLAAVWAGVCPSENTYNQDFGGFKTYFGMWTAKLIQLQMGWLGSTGVSSFATITNYVFDATTGLTTFTLGPGGLPWPNNSDAVRVRVRFPGKNWLDGTYLVTHTAATTCTTLEPMPAPPFTKAGTMEIIGSGFRALADPAAPLVNQGFIRATGSQRRKRGRPLYSSRGRQPNHINTWQ
jgi:hypothetical protein